MNFLKFGKKFGKIAGSFGLLFFYIFLPVGLIFKGLILAIIGFSIYAFIAEKARIESGNERFRKRGLFFRYGDEKTIDTLPIPVKDSWLPEDSANFGNSMMARIQKAFVDAYGNTPLNGRQIINVIGVTDVDRPSDSRGFLKISFAGSRGAIISRFITYQILGKKVVIHRLVYLLGIAQWYDKLFFFLSSPITIWFWIIKWLQNEYSIYGTIATEIDNSFEILDINAYYESTNEFITESINAELKVHGLYSAELATIVNNTFNDNRNFGNQISGNSGSVNVAQMNA